MNNENLKPMNQRTESEQREIAKLGGKASGEARRLKKLMREMLVWYLDQPVTPGDTETNKAAIAAALLTKCKDGDVRAINLLLDVIGENPAKQIDLVSSDGSLSPLGMLPRSDLSHLSYEQIYELAREMNRVKVEFVDPDQVQAVQ